MCHADGSFCTEEEQVAQVLALSETGGSSSSAPAPTPTPTPTPAPSPMPHVSLLVTFLTQPAPVHAPAASPTPAPATGDSFGVEVVLPGPQRPVAELIGITDNHSDASGGSSDDHDEVVDTSDVEVVGGANAEPRFSAPAPARLPPPPPPLPTWHEHISRTTGRPFYFNPTTRESVYAKPAELRGQTSKAGTAVVSTHAPARMPTPAPPPMPRGRPRWPRATRRDWHADANR